MSFGKPAGIVLAALLLGGVPQPERAGVVEQALTWVRTVWEAATTDPGTPLPGPETQPTSGPDEGAHIDPDG
ncbi:MAG TPA: hypothetical protein VH394_29325 [Thermoanaerobaculia bacterium]|jgi:hypothetical protein|nr:hypothetical protein [Thermoanaerobaculia bacterium]